MTWTKLTDTATDDPRMLALPRGIRLLHIEAMIWCNRTNGNIPRNALTRFTDEPDADNAVSALIHAEIWKVTNEGWEIIGFTDPAIWDQPTAEQVEYGRALKRDRQRRWRERRNPSPNPSRNALGDGALPSPAQPSKRAVAGSGGQDGIGLAAEPPTSDPMDDPAILGRRPSKVSINGEEVT